MCLSRIAPQEIVEKFGEEEVAYKIVYSNDGKGYSPLHKGHLLPFEQKYAKIGEGWESSELQEQTIFSNIEYKAGIHAYAKIEDAMREFYAFATHLSYKFALVKVRLEGKITVGYEGDDVVLVYKRMTIKEEIKEIIPS